MWGKASVPFLHAISFAFSVGALLGPVLIAAFLQDISGASTDNNSTSTSSLDWTTTASTSDSPDSMLPTLPSIKIFESVASIATGPAAADAMQIMQLKAAIYVSASLCFIAFALFTLFCALYPQNQAHPTRSDESNDPEERSRTNGAIRTHRKVLIGLSCVYIHLAHGLEVAVAGLLPVFAVRCLLHLSTASGSMLLALYWNCFTVARALAVPISICFRPKQMMIANLIVVSVANLILFPFAEHHEWVLWFGTALLGFGKAHLRLAPMIKLTSF